MTREKAVEVLRKIPVGLMDLSNAQKWDLTEAIDVALAALRPVSRERVEQMFPGCRSCKSCRSCAFIINELKDMPCKKCDPNVECILTEYKPSNFCPVCGKPLTDEAMDIVLRRLEALHGQKNP